MSALPLILGWRDITTLGDEVDGTFSWALRYTIGDEVYQRNLSFTRTANAAPFSPEAVAREQARIEDEVRAEGGSW